MINILFSFGPLEDFTLVTNNTMISIIDKKHRIWIHDWSLNGKFYEVLRNDEYTLKSTNSQYVMDMNEEFLCFTDCHEQLFLFSNCLSGRKNRRKRKKNRNFHISGIHWSLIEKGTRLQRLIGALPNESLYSLVIFF